VAEEIKTKKISSNQNQNTKPNPSNLRLSLQIGSTGV
jgi:hypothetical protein